MAVILKDVEMPRSCYECKFTVGHTEHCEPFLEYSDEHPYSIPASYRLDGCPLEEVVTCGECKYVQLSLRDEVKYCDVFFPDKPHYLPKDHFCGLGEKE